VSLPISPTALKRYKECPRKWYHTYVLHLTDWEGEEDVVSALTIGNTYHAILARYFTRTPRLGNEFDVNLLQQCIAENFAAPASLAPLGDRLLRSQSAALEMRLGNFLRAFTTRFANHRVVATEKKYSEVQAAYTLEGKIDLLLADDEGNRTIVDFKTGAPPKRGDCDGTGPRGLADFQLPLYTLLAGDPPVETALFFSINHAAPQVLFGDKGTKVPREQIMEETLHWVEKCADAIRRGSVAAEAADLPGRPERPDWATCAACGFRYACRTTYPEGE
jgi:hypothetical protein